MGRLGQHFLREIELLERIAELGEIKASDVVLEAGCGDGLLTQLLAKRGCRVIAVEIDDALYREAKERLSELSNVELYKGDVLRIKPSGFNKVVSNPPYSISTRLLQWLISERRPELIVMTLQSDFVYKLSARPGAPSYVYTSFLTQLYYDLSIAFPVPRGAFRPPPRVSSIVTVFRLRGSFPELSRDELEIAKRLFTLKRRRVRSALRILGLRMGDGLDEKRIYQLSPEELAGLIKQLIGTTREPL